MIWHIEVHSHNHKTQSSQSLQRYFPKSYIAYFKNRKFLQKFQNFTNSFPIGAQHEDQCWANSDNKISSNLTWQTGNCNKYLTNNYKSMNLVAVLPVTVRGMEHDANTPWNSSNGTENPGRMVAISTPLKEWVVGAPSPHRWPPLMGLNSNQHSLSLIAW